jgi:outer membrane protein assembly factor BamB
LFRSRSATRRRAWVCLALAAALGAAPAVEASAAGTPPPVPLPDAGACATSPGVWPEYQGDPTHSADACAALTPANVTSLEPAWFVATRGAVTDTPAVDFGSVFAGDYSGLFYAVNQATGLIEWTVDTTAAQNCFVDAADPHADRHASGFGQIPSSPATAVINGIPTVFVAAGGSLFALSAGTGRCLWAEDMDPATPTNSIEIESSPVVDTRTNPPEVLVGDDDNSSPGVGVTGLTAFNAGTGALLWRYEPERDTTLYPSEFGGSAAAALSCGDGTTNTDCSPTNVPGIAPNSTADADGCGDVWSSPALDSAFVDPSGLNSFQGSGTRVPAGWEPKRITYNGPHNRDGLVVFGTGNCSASPDPAAALAHGDYVDNQSIFALDPVTGVRVWNFVEPYNQYDNNTSEPGGGDDDFGSSPIVAALPASSVGAKCPVDPAGTAAGAATTSTLVLEGSKSGFAYGVCARNGHEIWAVHAAQSGQASEDLVGAVGGFLGSPSLGLDDGRPTAFFTSAIPTPFSNDGLREPGDGDTNISSCPGLGSAPLLPACPDTSLANDPTRAVGLHAIDAATGAVDFQAPAAPTYGASSYTDGVVLLPDSLAGSLIAYNADNGEPLRAIPLAAVPASGAAIAGDSVYIGTGETDASEMGESIPPQATGIWSFSTNPGEVTVTPPPAP